MDKIFHVEIDGQITLPDGSTLGPLEETTVNVVQPSEGGGIITAVSKGVNFIDYDGTVVAAWDVDEVTSKTALPNNPTHDGLTAQGWNWSLADIQSYISDYPDDVITVGQMYITDDGKTRIYIHLEEGRLSPYLGICPNGTVDIDWGDGTTHDIVTGRSVTTVVDTKHTYAHGGDYIIKLTVTGFMGIVGASNFYSKLLWKNVGNDDNRVYQNAVQKVEIGNSVTSIGTYAFSNCYSLKSVTIPNSVTSIKTYAFANCYSLKSVTIPNSVTSIDTYTFSNCYSLKSVTIPNSVTSILEYAFTYCQSLASVTIPKSVTSISRFVFNNCQSLASVTIPNSVTSIGNNIFAYCRSLTSVIIPNSVTSISDSLFISCQSLASVIIPNSVTSIRGSVFFGCNGLGFIKFESQTPPIVSNSSVWTYMPTDCIIYVPSGTLSTYQSATNYPSPSTYTYVEY